MRQVRSTRIVSKYKEVVILIDATYWGKSFGVLLIVDAYSMVISSVAFINSPPFVPMAAAAMRNKDVIVTGLGAGIVGYAVGNHLGVLMAQLLSLIP